MTSTSATANEELFSIAGRRTVITGGTAGIGLAVATHFVNAGANVVIAGRRRNGAVVADGIGARFVAMDVSDDASVKTGMEDAVAILGGLDVLILNAGVIDRPGPLATLDLDVFRRIFDVNFFGVMRGMRFGVPHLKAGGVVITTSSPGATRPVAAPGWSAYASSKAAVDFVTRAAGLELAGQGIRVCGVVPGFIRTEIGGESEAIDWLARMTSTGQPRRPDDMASIYHFLASEAGAMLQSSIVAADDGCSAGLSAPALSRLVGP